MLKEDLIEKPPDLTTLLIIRIERRQRRREAGIWKAYRKHSEM